MLKVSGKNRIEVLLEENNSNMKIVLEYVSVLPEMNERLIKVEGDIEVIKNDVEALKIGHKILQNDTKKRHALKAA